MHNEKGLTLPEVLVAMVVLSLGLLGLAKMQITAIQVNAASGRLTQATALAQDKAEELMALPYTDADLNVGKYSSKRADYTITWEVAQDTLAVGIKTINLTVTWSNRGQPKTFLLAFF